MQSSIDIKHLVKRYAKSETLAVNNISFAVQSGEFFALLGPNGAGKTTTLSILSTILSKTSGNVTIAGYDLDKQAKEVRQHIGIIFQNPSLDENLTAEENIRFHAVLYGLYSFRPTYSLMSKSYQDKVQDLAELLDIKKDIFRPIKTFSGGMKRKLEIIRSLIHNPKILFLDEPTSGLDPISRNNLWQYLNSIYKKEKMTIFLTTHYLEEAESADHVCIINHGKVVSLGTPTDIENKLLDEYLLIDAKERKKLEKELEELHFTYSYEDGLIKVVLKDKSAQEIISSIRTKLDQLKIHTPTLEEAYLEIVK